MSSRYFISSNMLRGACKLKATKNTTHKDWSPMETYFGTTLIESEDSYFK